MTPPLGGAISSIAYAALSKNFFYYKAADPYAHAQNQDAVIRLAEVPGLGIDSAQQVIAEVGVTASTFSSAAEFTSWVGTCPGKEESAEENCSSRSAKGNKYMRRVLNQASHAAARSKGAHFQAVFRRMLPRLGYQSAVWAIFLLDHSSGPLIQGAISLGSSALLFHIP